MSLSARRACLGVSTRSGNRLLIVTLSTATSKESDLQNAVNPVRAEVESAICGLGLFTMAEVILTIRPNLRSFMPGTNARVSAMQLVRSSSTMRSPSSQVLSKRGEDGGTCRGSRSGRSKEEGGAREGEGRPCQQTRRSCTEAPGHAGEEAPRRAGARNFGDSGRYLCLGRPLAFW